MNNCNIYNIHNCNGSCYLCNTTNYIANNYGILTFCKTTDFCIKEGTSCDERLFLDNCIITNNFLRTVITLVNVLAFSVSFKRITNTFEVYQYDKIKQGICLLSYSTTNLAIPSILLFTTNTLYFIYFMVCIVSYIYIFTCLPKLKKTEYFINKHYTNYNSLSNTLPITPIQSRTESPVSNIISNSEQVDPENSIQTPIIQSYT